MLADHDRETKPKIGAEVVATQDCSESLRCVSNCEDTVFDGEALLDQENSVLGMGESVNVDVLECTDTSEVKLVKDDDPDATEYSSSFGETVSGAEDGSRLSEAEVESRFCGDDGMAPNVFDGLDGLFRIGKKKLTSHWRRYICPLMWRCKWIELRMKELRSQALKYDRELVATGQRKHLELDKYSSECGVKSLPFTGIGHRQKVMRRRKRKRIEETVDIPSYMSHHNLFSYYENKRSDPDGASMDDDCGIQVEANNNNHDEFDFNDGCSSLQFRDDDGLEELLWKIEKVQSRVQKLRIHMDKLLTVNAVKFSSVENLSLLAQSDQPSSSTRSQTLSPRNGDIRPIGSLYTPPRNMPEYDDIGDMVMMESAVSSYEEASPPDIIESTMGLLSAAEVSHDQQQNGDSCENIADDVLIHNQAAEKELHHFEQIGSLLIEKPQDLVKDEQDKVVVSTSASASASASEHGPTQGTTQTQEQSVLKSCLASEFRVPKTKRKRGERKAGAGAWNADKISIK